MDTLDIQSSTVKHVPSFGIVVVGIRDGNGKRTSDLDSDTLSKLANEKAEGVDVCVKSLAH